MRNIVVIILLSVCAFTTYAADSDKLPECNCIVDKLDPNSPNYQNLQKISAARKQIAELKNELLVTYLIDVTQTDALKSQLSVAQIEALIQTQVAGNNKIETKESRNRRYLTFTFVAKMNEVDHKKFEDLAAALQTVSGDTVTRTIEVVVSFK